MSSCGKKIHLERGMAYTLDGSKKVPVQELEATCCDCKIDVCNCSLKLKDLGTGGSYRMYIYEGSFYTVSEADFQEMVEIGDFAPPVG